VAGPYRASRIAHELAVPLPAPPAFFDFPKGPVPLMLGHFQRKADIDRKARIANQERLRALKLNHGDRVMVVNSHDPVDYEHCRCGGH
jgi:hypothetical protein